MRWSLVPVSLVLALGLPLGACRMDIGLDTSNLACADGHCPSGFACAADDLCHAQPPPTSGTCNPTTLVADDFEGGAPLPLWGRAFGANGAFTSQTQGRLRIELPAGGDRDAYAGYATDSYYDLVGSHISVEAATMVDTRSNAQMLMQIFGREGASAELAGFVQEHGTLRLFARLGLDETSVAVSYDPVAHRFWQLREDDGDLIFETSPDGARWTVQRRMPAPFDLSLVRVDLTAGVYHGELAPGVAEFDDLNGGSPVGSLCKMATLVDDFEDDVIGQAWAQSYETATCRLDETDGALVAATEDASSATYCAYRSAAAFDLEGSQIVVEVAEMIEPEPGSPGQAFLKLTGDADDHGVELIEHDGVLDCRVWNQGRFESVEQHGWDEDADRFWKIAEAGGVVTWSTSPEGTSWSIRCTVPTSSVDVDDVEVSIGTGVIAGVPFGRPVGVFRVAGVNLAP